MGQEGTSKGMNFDALVIGAGPIGSYLAGQLVSKGYSVLVIEKRSSLGGPVCCTGLISRECLEMLGPSATVIRELNGARIFSPSGKALDVSRPTPQAYLIDRGALDLNLALQAQQDSASYIFGSQVLGLEINNDGARARVWNKGGAFEIEARVVIIASGFGSKVTSRLGLGQVGDFAIGAQALVESEVEEVEVYPSDRVSPGLFGWLVPERAGRALVGLLAKREPLRRLSAFMDELEMKGKIGSPVIKPMSRGLSLKPLPRTYSGPIIVVGDAAGQNKPTTGGGLFFGLLGAQIASEVVPSYLEGKIASLSVYEKMWHERLSGEIRKARVGRFVYEKMSDRQRDRLFYIINRSNFIDQLEHDESLSFDWHGRVILKLLFSLAPWSFIRKE